MKKKQQQQQQQQQTNKQTNKQNKTKGHRINLTLQICLQLSPLTARFVVTLIVLKKWKVFDGLQIHPKKLSKYKNKARKVRRYSAKDM